MAPFLPFVHTPEQLEGKRAEPGQVGSEIASLLRYCVLACSKQHVDASACLQHLLSSPLLVQE